jgi:hypothetical protein
MGLNRFFRVDVVHAHEPAWAIGADGQKRHARGAETRADRGKMRACAGIAHEVDAAGAGGKPEAGPQRAIAVA